MVTTRSAADLAGINRQRLARLTQGSRSMTAGSHQAAKIAQAEAVKLSQGTTSSAALRAAGHPFAKKRSLGRLGRLGDRSRAGAAVFASYPLLPINRQSGRLARSWRVIRAGDGYRLQNFAPESKFVLRRGGTRYMVDRRFWDELHRRALPKVRREILTGWREALR